jgi:dipeptidyl aminopeptidase/acylaminoacyl peptidase
MDSDIIRWIGYSFLGISLFQYSSLVRPKKIISQNKPRSEYEDVKFTTDDGVELAGWWIPGKNNATIIVGHGYPFDKGNIYQGTRWLHPEFNLLYYDHRSFGESKGSMTTGGIREVKDVEAAINFVKSKTDGPIGLFGFSFSAAAMLMSNHENVKALVADSSYSNIKQVLSHIFSQLGILRWPFIQIGHLYAKLLGVDLDKAPLQHIKNIKLPLLLIHGDADTQIPLENAKQLFEVSNKNNTDLLIIPNADHGQTLISKRVIKTVKRFFKLHLSD